MGVGLPVEKESAGRWRKRRPLPPWPQHRVPVARIAP